MEFYCHSLLKTPYEIGKNKKLFDLSLTYLTKLAVNKLLLLLLS